MKMIKEPLTKNYFESGGPPGDEPYLMRPASRKRLPMPDLKDRLFWFIYLTEYQFLMGYLFNAKIW